MSTLNFNVVVPDAVCMTSGCTTPSAPYSPQLIELEDSGFVARNVVIPAGWVAIVVSGISGVVCPTCAATVTAELKPSS